MLITNFSSSFTSSKVPSSPFGDNTFIFETVKVSPAEFLEQLRNEFTLNRNYNFKKPTRLRKTIRELKENLNKTLEFLILDLDNIKSKYAENQIIQFFKDNDYFVGLIPSRGYNGINNYNLKGFILANGTNNKASLKAILEEINQGIYIYCKVDSSVIIESYYQAPTYSTGIKLYQEGNYIPSFHLKEEIKQHIEIELDKTHNKVLESCLNEYRLRGFQLVKLDKNDTLLVFSHPSERTPKGYFCYVNNPFYMNHFNADKSFSIFSALKDNKYAKEYFEKINEAKRIQEFSGIGNSNDTIRLNTRYLAVNSETKSLVSKLYKTKGLLKIKSAMGTGKSNIIDYCINKSDKKGLRTLLITNRISVAKDFNKKYDIKIYSDGNYQHGDNLIVQYDSLWKYSLKHFDVVILDEYISLMLHTRNTLSDYGNLNKTKLMYAMRSKICIIADAFLFGAEDDFIGTVPKYCINNEYRENINLYEYPNIKSIAEKIVVTALKEKNKKKVSVSCTSKSTAEAINEICTQKGLKTMYLSSDTLDVDKEMLYKEFEKEWHDYWDVLIYTPTLTVGVSNLNNTDNHFHIDESNSADVVSSLQMIRRTRKAKNIHYTIAKRKRFLETNINTLNKEINDNIQKYYKNNSSILISIDEYGDFNLSETGKFINKIEIMYNKLELNHAHSFELLLKHQVKKERILVNDIKTDIDITKIKKELKEKQINVMKGVLENLEPIEYNENVLEEYKERNYIVSDKDKMLKLLSDVRKNTKNKTPLKIVREITRLEINKKFKFLAELKSLKLYLSKNESDIKNLLSYIVSENTVNRTQIIQFKYIISLKKHSINLKNKFTSVEINKINDKLSFGDFKSYLKKIGYKKRGLTFYLGEEYINYSKYMK